MRAVHVLSTTALFLLVTTAALAQVVFSDNFSSAVDFTANDPYWLNNNDANGFVVKTTNSSAIYPGVSDAFGNAIPQDVSGTGFFLFTRTTSYDGGNIPVGTTSTTSARALR